MLKEKELLVRLDLSCVKHIGMASAPVSRSLFNSLKSTFPKAAIVNNYGITEVSPGMFGKHPTLPTPDLSVGYPIPGIDYRIVDGILQVRSPSMFLKYNNLDIKNLTDDGYFITNDLFEVDKDGFYFFLGRGDDMFVCGGNNVYPRQIESVLESHPFVQYAVVIGVEDEDKGMKPYAFVVSNSNEDELKTHALKFLPPSHCPRKIWNLETLPLNSVNKVDKAKLKEQARVLLNGV
jgi:acyl-coenzyme A synthetase/AMP-(fatty) acid ligase